MLAVIPTALLLIYLHFWRQKISTTIGAKRLITQLLDGISIKRRRTKAILIITAIALLGFAMPNLQKPVEQAGGGVTGLDVMILLDVSNSMLATDIQPNRLEKARLLAAKLIDYMQGNRVGIIAFAGEAYLQMPLSADIAAARLYLQSVSPSLSPLQGTNIYDALQLANRSMNPAEKKYKAVVLISDGEELADNALKAATDLKNAGLVILSVGIGSATGSTLVTETGDSIKDNNGKTVISKLNQKMLEKLAFITNGSYCTLGETDETLKSITTELQQMDKKLISNTTLVNYKSYSYWIVLLAFILLVIEFVLPERKQKIAEKNSVPTGLKPILLCLAFILSIPHNSFSQNTKILLERANEAYRQSQYTEAEKLYKKVLEADGKNAIAQYNLGNIAYRKKQYDQALPQYTEASKIASKKADKAGAMNNMGLSYLEQKKIQNAIEEFKASIRQNPYDADVRSNLNKALHEKQQQDKQNNKNQNGSNKQQQPPPAQAKNDPSKAIKADAEDKLAALQQEERKIREANRNKQNQINSNGKNW